MKTTTSQKLKTGIFTLAGIGVLLVIIFLIGRQKSLFAHTFSVNADFKNVSGLQTGNFVRFAGINIGTVSGISIKNDSTVRVEMVLQTEVKPYIKSDSKASIGSDGLMGDKLVELSAGSDSVPLQHNNQVMGVEPMSMDHVMHKFERIADNAEIITGNLGDIVSKINNGKGSLGRLLNSDDFERGIETTVNSANQTVQNIGKAASNITEDAQAVKGNFLFKGYFKKKEKKRIQDSINAAKAAADSLQNLKTKKKG